MSYLRELLREVRDGINLIDIGCSGQLDHKWTAIKADVNVVGFDPNEEECRRLSETATGFRSARYLPYAVGGFTGKATLYKTKNVYCYSLLRPDNGWSDRFAYRDYFRVVGTEEVSVRSLTNLEELKGLDADVIKSDTQGLELPILAAAGELLDRAFLVEVETGFVENYIGETTFAAISEFLRSRGFLMFDLNANHRVARNNVMKRHPTGREQILWCESVWLRDYVAAARSISGWAETLTRKKAIKALVICAIEGCFDYGLELAELFVQLGFMNATEIDALQLERNWSLGSRVTSLMTNLGLRMIPGHWRVRLHNQLGITLGQPNVVRSLLASTKNRLFPRNTD